MQYDKSDFQILIAKNAPELWNIEGEDGKDWRRFQAGIQYQARKLLDMVPTNSPVIQIYEHPRDGDSPVTVMFSVRWKYDGTMVMGRNDNRTKVLQVFLNTGQYSETSQSYYESDNVNDILDALTGKHEYKIAIKASDL